MLIATEKAAIAAYSWLGKDNKHMADQAAVSAMRKQLNLTNFHGTIKIGEGERDKAPMLSIGEIVGNQKGIRLDIALDPLEGTSMCAKGESGSLSVLAIARPNTILHSPDVYMDKLITSSDIEPSSIDLNKSLTLNLKAIAKQKKNM
ncbi:fructose-1,6-bisphosphatase 2 (fragment) [Candidatus Xenohaliotis californiensis]|uniref:fructose-bisphosphatase n=1 Tax=Candidatus Xenohaliotis californiensis TaxID=84677 RepID=A0ABP0ESJ2_9RICK